MNDTITGLYPYITEIRIVHHGNHCLLVGICYLLFGLLLQQRNVMQGASHKTKLSITISGLLIWQIHYLHFDRRVWTETTTGQVKVTR